MATLQAYLFCTDTVINSSHSSLLEKYTNLFTTMHHWLQYVNTHNWNKPNRLFEEYGDGCWSNKLYYDHNGKNS